MSWYVEPLIYGYLRVSEDLEDDELQQLEHGLHKLAEAEGFCLTDIRSEHQPGYYGTFYELTEELKRAPVRHVVMPSPDHLSAHPLLREQLIRRLDEAKVRLWVVES
ncbi:MAG: recombinase family protein [Pseudonocardiaceae bacterium]